MADTYTAAAKARKIEDQTRTGTWASPLNTEAIDLLDDYMGGVEAINLGTSTTKTLAAFANGTDSESRAAVLRFTGTPASAVTITVPASVVDKRYRVENSTGQRLTIKYASGTGVVLGNLDKCDVWCDGSEIYDRGPGSRITAAEIAASVTPVNYQVPNSDVCGYVIIDRYATNATPGATVMTTAINNAILVAAQASCGILGYNTYLTAGGHTLSSEQIFGTGKGKTVFKKDTGGADVMFTITGLGSMNDCTIDGNTLNGDGILLSTTASDTIPAWLSSVELKNFGATVTTANITAITRGTTTTIAASGHGLSNGQLCTIRSVTGVVATGSPSQSVVHGIWRVSGVAGANFNIDHLDTTSFTAWSSGGTVERASFGLRIEQASGTALSISKQFDNVSFRGNYGHVYLGGVYGLNFYATTMIGNTLGCAVYASSADCQNVTFDGISMQSGIMTGPYNVRGLTFSNVLALLNSSWNTKPFFESIGQNNTDGCAGGEVSGTRFYNLTIQRQFATTDIPLFKTNAFDFVIRDMRIVDTAANSGWHVFDDFGTFNMVIDNVFVQSTNTWEFFKTVPSYSQAGGLATALRNVNYEQGTQGNIALSSASYGGGITTGQCRIDGTNNNVSINAVAGGAVRAYTIMNVRGNVDLTNLSAGGTVCINVTGTITNQVAASLVIPTDGTGPRMAIPDVYANNAAALGGGLTAGALYKTAATGTATVNITNAT